MTETNLDKIAALRRWRSEHDCRYTLGDVADIDGIHCPIDNPCVRCQRRMEWESAQENNADLRAALKLMEHKVITCGVAATNSDAALTLRADYMQWNSPQAEAVRAIRAERDELRAYKQRTEAALQSWCFDARGCGTEADARWWHEMARSWDKQSRDHHGN